MGGIGSRALNPNLHLSALKRLSNGTATGRAATSSAYKSDCARDCTHFRIKRDDTAGRSVELATVEYQTPAGRCAFQDDRPPSLSATDRGSSCPLISASIFDVSVSQIFIIIIIVIRRVRKLIFDTTSRQNIGCLFIGPSLRRIRINQRTAQKIVNLIASTR